MARRKWFEHPPFGRELHAVRPLDMRVLAAVFNVLREVGRRVSLR
jgi:hypothetical protein